MSPKLIATAITALIVTVAGAAVERYPRIAIGGAPLTAENREMLQKELETRMPANVRLTVVIEDRVIDERRDSIAPESEAVKNRTRLIQRVRMTRIARAPLTRPSATLSPRR